MVTTRRVLAAVLALTVVTGTGTSVHARTSGASTDATGSAVAAQAADAQTAAAPWPATGALFVGTADDPGAHFCSASVVASAAGNMIMTAAHCVADGDGTPPRTGMTFAPGYQNGVAPHGYWTVTSAGVGPAWLADGDPDDDVAYLTVDRPGSPPIQQVTGAYRVDFTDPVADVDVTAVGYNTDEEEATTVSGTATPWSSTQWELDAPGLSDGASGGPLLGGPAGTEIVGVVGGHEQGGDTSDVSYAAALGTALRSLYNQAGGVD
jgi:V8-like Glu-specific endopeptidase